MASHIWYHARLFGVIFATWFMIRFLCAWAPDVGFLLVIFGFPVLICVYLVGGIVHVVQGIKAARHATRTRERIILAATAPLMMVTTIVLTTALGGR